MYKRQVQDVDAAMTELKKVTDLSDSSALEFMDKAAVKAKELGASMSGYINSVADWSRLGYKPVSYTHLDVYKRQEDMRDEINRKKNKPQTAGTDESSSFLGNMVASVLHGGDVYKRQPLRAIRICSRQKTILLLSFLTCLRGFRLRAVSALARRRK